MKIRRYSAKTFFLIGIILIMNVFTFIMVNKSRVDVSKAKRIDFPIVLIQTDYNNPITSKDKYLTAKISFENMTLECQIRGRGNSTWENPKKPYLVKFKHNVSFLGMPEDNKWVFLTNATDNTALRNAYGTYLAKNVFDKQKWIPEYRFISLYLNGNYEGLYQVYEKISGKENKLNLDKDDFLVVSNTRESKVYNFRSEICNNGFSIYDPRNPSGKNANKIIDKVNALEKVIFSEDFKNSETGYRSIIDLDSWIDWYWINEFTTNRDARLKDSCYFYFNSSDNKFYMGPSWDFDISCGNNSYEGCSTPDTFWVRTEGNWFKRLFEDEYFEQKVKERYFEVHQKLEESIVWLEEQTKNRNIQLAKKYDDRVWRTIGHFQWPHATGWATRRTYEAECDYLLTWVKDRITFIDKELNK